MKKSSTYGSALSAPSASYDTSPAARVLGGLAPPFLEIAQRIGRINHISLNHKGEGLGQLEEEVVLLHPDIEIEIPREVDKGGALLLGEVELRAAATAVNLLHLVKDNL